MILARYSFIKTLDKTMAEIYFLGTGGWIATRERDNTSLMIQHNEKLVLVDCPGSVIQKIKKIDLNPESIVSVIITHVHPDHVYGLPSLVHSLMLVDCTIYLYGKKESILFCQNLLDLFHLREEKIKCRINFVPVKSKEDFFVLPSLSCSCLDVPHHPSSLAFSFEFKDSNKRLFFSGDTPIYPPIFEAAKDIDYLIHECSAPKRYFDLYPILYDIHTCAYDLGRLSQNSGVKCLIPCHIFGDLDFSESEIEQELRKSYFGRLYFLNDLEKLSI